MKRLLNLPPLLLLLVFPALFAGCEPSAAYATAAAWWHVWLPVGVVVLSSIVTALTRYPRAATVVGVLQVLVDLCSALSHADSPGAVKLPLTRSKPPAPRPPLSSAPTPPPVTLLLVGLGVLALSTLPGCACWQPSSPKFATTQCQIARQSVDCGKASAQSLAAPGMAVAKTLIDSGTVDVPTVEGALIQMGFSSAQCILAALAADFSKPRASSNEPTQVQQYRAQFVANWRAAS